MLRKFSILGIASIVLLMVVSIIFLYTTKWRYSCSDHAAEELMAPLSTLVKSGDTIRKGDLMDWLKKRGVSASTLTNHQIGREWDRREGLSAAPPKTPGSGGGDIAGIEYWQIAPHYDIMWISYQIPSNDDTKIYGIGIILHDK
jgi:hypothetical protein